MLQKFLFVCSVFTLSAFATDHPRIEVQGHRGARARRPENTLPAYQYALEIGADAIELDLAVTKDDQLVASHDPEILPTRCLGAKGEILKTGVVIHTLTLEEVKRYDCGSVKNPKFPDQELVPGTRIPTLDEIFSMVEKSAHPNAKKLRFNIETKSYLDHPEFTPSPREFTELVLNVIRKRGMIERSELESFDYRTLVESKKIEPKLAISALTEDPFANSLDIARQLSAEIVSPEWSFVSPAYTEALHARHVLVLPWTVNTPRQWSRLIESGVDGMITDDPAALIEYLKVRGLR